MQLAHHVVQMAEIIWGKDTGKFLFLHLCLIGLIRLI